LKVNGGAFFFSGGILYSLSQQQLGKKLKANALNAAAPS